MYTYRTFDLHLVARTLTVRTAFAATSWPPAKLHIKANLGSSAWVFHASLRNFLSKFEFKEETS
jgi:hypothetical protein